MSGQARRVSFQEDVSPIRRRCVGLTRSSPSTMSPSATQPCTVAPSSILKNSVTVLHGRVVKSNNEDGDVKGNEDMNPKPRNRSNKLSSIRETMMRKSSFFQLKDETAQFKKQVASLESIIRRHQDSVMSTEGAWRVRVLLKTAQDNDQSLWIKLYEFEKTLLSKDATSTTQDELRLAQTECMKLHRDFKHSHRTLLMCQSLTESISPCQNSTASLSVVGWSGGTSVDGEETKEERPMMVKNLAVHTEQRETFRKSDPSSTLFDNQLSTEVAYTSFRKVHKNAIQNSNGKRQSRNSVVLERGVHPLSGDSELLQSELDNRQSDSGDFFCGALSFYNNDTEDDKDDDASSVRESHFYKRLYKSIRNELNNVQCDLAKVGKNLGCGISDDEMVSSRFNALRQASF